MEFVKINHLKKKFKHKVCLEFPPMKIKQGKLYLLLGDNGSGKSTFIKMLCKLIYPDCGKIELANISLGYAPERVYFPDILTINDFLRQLCHLRLMDNYTTNQRIKMFLDKWELDGNKSLHHVSKGMMQKIVLIQAMIHYPSLYIFDEPLSGLDKRMQQLFYKEIIYLKKHKKTIIIATHHPKNFIKLADDIFHLKMD